MLPLLYRILLQILDYLIKNVLSTCISKSFGTTCWPLCSLINIHEPGYNVLPPHSLQNYVLLRPHVRYMSYITFFLQASPWPDVIWLKDGVPVSKRVTISNAEGGSQILIPSAERNDTGIYTILVKNIVGQETCSIEIRVTGKMRVPVCILSSLRYHLKSFTHSLWFLWNNCSITKQKICVPKWSQSVTGLKTATSPIHTIGQTMLLCWAGQNS